MSICMLFILILLKRLNSEYALLTACIINISITLLSLGFLVPVFDYIKELMQNENTQRLTSMLFKSAGICLLCSVAAEISADCKEESLAKRIEFAGKCTLIAYVLPLIKEVMNHASDILS